MPRKRSPSSVLASKAWRPAAIRNTALLLVSAPQSVRLPPAVFQPVSSMLTTDAALICCSSRVWGAASASPARWMIASTEPVASSTPNSSRASSVVSRRETRLRPANGAQPVLGHPDRDRRQLSDLVPPRLRGVDQLLPVEHTRARAAPPRPMLDDLVHPLGRKQASVPPFVTGLAAARPAGSRPGRSRRRRRRVLRRRQRRVPRAPLQPPLELCHPSLEPLVRLDQLADPNQQRDRRLPVAVEDRLRLGPLHRTQLRRASTGPCTGPERLPKTVDMQVFF